MDTWLIQARFCLITLMCSLGTLQNLRKNSLNSNTWKCRGKNRRKLIRGLRRKSPFLMSMMCWKDKISHWKINRSWLLTFLTRKFSGSLPKHNSSWLKHTWIGYSLVLMVGKWDTIPISFRWMTLTMFWNSQRWSSKVILKASSGFSHITIKDVSRGIGTTLSIMHPSLQTSSTAIEWK